MDQIDRELLNVLQKGLPLAADPYGIIAEGLKIPKAEVLERIIALKEEGYIRRLGASFDAKAMGYTSVLCGAKVSADHFYEVSSYIKELPQVTHNYKRNGELNMWFTLATAHPLEKDKILSHLRDFVGVEALLEFPKRKDFKLKVFFDMKESGE